MNKLLIGALAATGIILLIFLGRGLTQNEDPALTALAQCLTAKGVVMYGADWCAHCQNEKRAFGPAFRHIDYVECPKEPKRCLELGIEGYPTWILADGQRLAGEQGPAKLAAAAGCPLPPAGAVVE